MPNEDDLRSEISVSRTAYREAVKVLTAKGLVEARPKSGTRVAPRDSWNLLDPDVLSWHFEADPNEKFIRDLFELRRFVEPERGAARGAAPHACRPRAHRGRLSRHDRQPALCRGDDPRRSRLPRGVFAAAHNATLQCLASVVSATIQWSLLLKSVDDQRFFVASLVDHERVLDAIIQRDGDLAAARMTTLVIDSLNTTLAFLTPGASATIHKTA